MSFIQCLSLIAYRRQWLLGWPAFLLLSVVPDSHGVPDATMNQVNDFIRQEVKTFVNTVPGASFSVSVRPAKKTPAECQQPLSMSRQSSRRPPVGVVRVSVECPGDWRAYMVADVSVKVPAVFTRRSLARGEKISLEDIQIVTAPWEQLRKHYFLETDKLVGRELKRSLKAGTVMDSCLLVPDYLVRKGDSVLIQAGNNGLEIAMAGIAMENGLLEDSIRVRNRSSGKVLHATVTAKGKVQVGY